MKKITWISPYLDIVLDEVPLDSKDILEVGCGSGIFGFILKKTRPDAVIHGVEPFKYPLGHYDFIFRKTWDQFWKDAQSYDVIICNETIEHMDKKSALNFLNEARTVANKVIVGTPYQFDQQDPYDDNPYQVHQCVLTEKDFHDNGYETKIISFNDKKGIRAYSNSRLTDLLGCKKMNIIGVWNDSS